MKIRRILSARLVGTVGGMWYERLVHLELETHSELMVNLMFFESLGGRSVYRGGFVKVIYHF